MNPITANVTIKSKGRNVETTATKMRLSLYRCFAYDNGAEDKRSLGLIAGYLKDKKTEIALYGDGPFCKYLLDHAPELKACVKVVLSDEPAAGKEVHGIPVAAVSALTPNIKTVFLCETRVGPLMSMRQKLPKGVEVVTPEIIKEIDWQAVPERAWVPEHDTIYPFALPEIRFEPGQDLILIDCPARNLALMPNGLAYVHNALKKTTAKFQTVDLDIIFYHRYHMHRLLDAPLKMLTPGGREMAADPWLAEAYDEWQNPEVIEYFRSDINEVIAKLVEARPKILGLSIQACNIRFAREVVNGVKARLPDTVILVGGYSCYQPTIGRKAFPESDYMTIGEADLTVGPLVEALARGERPKDTPGIFSRFDTPGFMFKEAPMPQDLDAIEIPKYDWTDLSLYRNYNRYQLTPIIATRGCRWSRCTFCAERFFWRARSPKNVVDEFQWLYEQGCDLFMFNESDLNGKPEILLEICDEIVRRGLKINLTGQLRISKGSNRAFFDRLRAGGFVALRFGVDAWSTNGVRQQMKGYTADMIYQNLKDCWEAGIYTEVNTVIGVPGETEADIDESIELIVKCKPYIGRAANINPLMLVYGSVYWENPDKFKVKFRGDKDELFLKYPSLLPHEFWYSEDPYIDQPVRLKRFERIVTALQENGFDVGAFASRVIQDIKEGKGADHSARPDMANEQDKKFEIASCEASSAKAATEAIRAQSGLFTETVTPEKSYRVFNYGGEFYGLVPGEGVELEALSTKASVRKRGRLDSALRAAFEKGGNLLRDRERMKWLSRRAYQILSSEGVGGLARRAAEKLRKLSRSHALVLESDGLLVKRDYSSAIRLIYQGFHGYNLIEVKGDYYGIKQGHPFDKDQADAGKYELGACFKARTVKHVEEAIVEHFGRVGGPMVLLKEGFHSYNIVEMGLDVYGIKQGHPLDKARADTGGYEAGVCFRGKSQKDVEQLISKHLESLLEKRTLVDVA